MNQIVEEKFGFVEKGNDIFIPFSRIIDRIIEDNGMSDGEEIRVVVSGDGRKICTGRATVLFTIFDCKSTKLYTFAILECKEDFVNLSSRMNAMWETIISTGSTYKSHPMRTLFQSDLKMLNVLSGCGGFSSTNFCTFCTISKDANKLPLHKRTQWHMNSQRWSGRAGSVRKKNKNILAEKFMMTDIILDPLHLKLRVCGSFNSCFLSKPNEHCFRCAPSSISH
jgi:hypothetical protein